MCLCATFRVTSPIPLGSNWSACGGGGLYPAGTKAASQLTRLAFKPARLCSNHLYNSILSMYHQKYDIFIIQVQQVNVFLCDTYAACDLVSGLL